jgi:hypothetical protein
MENKKNTDQAAEAAQHHEELPPFFKTWNQMYAALLIYLVAIIIAFYLFTITFA